MSIPTTLSIEQWLLQALQWGPRRIVGIIDELKDVRPGTTKQGVYAALRVLKKQEKVVLHRGRASLNSAWVSSMASFFSIAQKYYRDEDSGDGNFLHLQDGEKISYSFKDAVLTDAFWGHAFHLLVATEQPNTPVYLYNPHQWFLIAREKSEKELLSFVLKNKRQYLLTVGSSFPLDKHISSLFDGEQSQYYVRSASLFPKNNYYFNIIGDFIIEAWIDVDVANKVDDVYASSGAYTETIKKELEKIISSQGKTKLVISRNKRKADKYKSMLKKYFYFPK